MKKLIIKPFREVYRMKEMRVTYYGWERSRIKALFSAIETAFFMVILAFRILMRISPSVD